MTCTIIPSIVSCICISPYVKLIIHVILLLRVPISMEDHVAGGEGLAEAAFQEMARVAV
jgi:hypothetical protein